jgi:hypothetical protein
VKRSDEDYWRRPDLAIGPQDVKQTNAGLRVTVHNLGNRPVDTVLVRAADATSEPLAEQTIPRIKAPVDLKLCAETLTLTGLKPDATCVVKVDPGEALIAAAPVLLVDHRGVAGSLRAVRIAQAHGGQVVADFERVSEPGFEELAAEVDHLIVSERFANAITGAHDPAQAAAELATPRRKAVVGTCGAAGCWYLAPAVGGLPRRFPAYPVEVADTTGCGDVFHGAYAAALVQGQDIASRIAFASAAAALKATQPGGQSGLPTRQEVQRFLVPLPVK